MQLLEINGENKLLYSW